MLDVMDIAWLGTFDDGRNRLPSGLGFGSFGIFQTAIQIAPGSRYKRDCSAPMPISRNRVIFLDTSSKRIHVAQGKLRVRIAFSSRLQKPARRGLLIFWNTLAICIHLTDEILCIAIALFRQWQQFMHGKRVVTAVIGIGTRFKTAPGKRRENQGDGH